MGHSCGYPQQRCNNCARITARQLALPPTNWRSRVTPVTRYDYLRHARWWELEAQRGYESNARSVEYARNMRWAAELAGIHGPGTWSELLQRSRAQLSAAPKEPTDA